MNGPVHDSIVGMPADTTADAHARQREIYRAMGGASRLRIAFELTATARHLALAGIRQRHPDYTDAQVQQAWARLMLGDSLHRAAWPDRPLIEP